MKKNLLFIIACLCAIQINAQSNSKLEQLMQVGDTIVLTADTSIILCYKQQENSRTDIHSQGVGTFSFQGIDYKLSISVAYFKHNGKVFGPIASIMAWAKENKNHFFSAAISASIKKTGEDKVILNSCKHSFASKGTRSAACELIGDDPCDKKTISVNGSPCEWSASYEPNSLANAVVNYMIDNWKLRR